MNSLQQFIIKKKINIGIEFSSNYVIVCPHILIYLLFQLFKNGQSLGQSSRSEIKESKNLES